MQESEYPPTSEHPLFLAPLGRPGDLINGERLGYVTRPEQGVREPECVGPAIVNGYAEAAQFHRTLQHLAAVEQARERRPELPPDARVRDLRRRAKDSHVDLSHELHIITRDLEKARMAGRTAPQRALTRIEGLEALLDGVELAA